MLFSNFTIEGPIKEDKISFLASGRRSYFDLFIPLVGGSEAVDKFHFYDLNTKLSWNINKNNKLYASGFFAADIIQFNQVEDNEDGGFDSDLDLGWTNATATLRWNHIFSNKLFANITSDNKPSLTLFERQGFTTIGTKKEWIYSKGHFKDEILLQLINS